MYDSQLKLVSSPFYNSKKKMTTVDFFIENTLKEEKYFPCPIRWNATKAVAKIRDSHELTGGDIRRNGEPLDDDNVPFASQIKEGDNLTFVNGKKIFLIV